MTKQVKESDKMTKKEEVIVEEFEANVNPEDSIKETVDEQADNTQLDEIEQLKLKNEDLQNRLFRTLADHENFKKRVLKEKEDIAKFATLNLVETLLFAIDNFERALQTGNEAKNYDSLIQGVEMVYRQLDDALKKEGLESIEAIGQPFNPEYHQAVMQVETDQYESGFVVEELQKGYKFKGKVIRPSMVKVSA